MAKRKLICSNHELIILNANKIFTHLKGYKNKNFTTIRKLIKEIIVAGEEAEISGQHMENRLTSYKKSIENLGFIRNKGKGYESL